MKYLKRLQRASERSERRYATNWSVLALLLAGGLGLAWYVLQFEVPENIVPAPVLENGEEEGQEIATSTAADVPASSGTYSGVLREYYDPTADIGFRYPVEWGIIQSERESGNCPDAIEECHLTLYRLQDPASGEWGTIAAAVTAGYRDFPPGRGSQWYDQILAVSDIAEYCQATNCQRVNENVQLNVVSVPAAPRFEGFGSPEAARPEVVIPRYMAEFTTTPYTHLILSSEELGWLGEAAHQAFLETVIATLE